MNKKDRQIVFDKCGGRCAYCGCELSGKWHADHCNPVHRFTKNIQEIVTKDTGIEPTEDDIINNNYKFQKRKERGMMNPHNDCIDNMLPACVSCNIYKHSADLETFRWMLSNTIVSLSKNSTQYKFGKRFGIIQETPKQVIFYFETLTPLPLTN